MGGKTAKREATKMEFHWSDRNIEELQPPGAIFCGSVGGRRAFRGARKVLSAPR